MRAHAGYKLSRARPMMILLGRKVINKKIKLYNLIAKFGEIRRCQCMTIIL